MERLPRVLKPEERIILALDVPTAEEAERYARQFQGRAGAFKVGKQIHTADPEIIQRIKPYGPVFLDIKVHDIPRTAGAAALAAAEQMVWMLNAHTAGGRKMMMEMAKRLLCDVPNCSSPPLLIGVTVLTSTTEIEFWETLGLPRELNQIFPVDLAQIAARRALMAQECGFDGVVCSALDLPNIRRLCGWEFITVVPGTRSVGVDHQDQNRVDTPRRAIERGADYLVIGSQVLRAQEPFGEFDRVCDEIAVGMSMRIARQMLESGAIAFDLEKRYSLNIHNDHPGAPRSPFYVNCRQLRSTPRLAFEVAETMALMARKSGIEFDLIADIPTAFTPIVSLISQILGVPMISPRVEALKGEVKSYGAQNEIDGQYRTGQRVAVFDDVFTTGATKGRAKRVLEQNRLVPVAFFGLLDRREKEGEDVEGLPAKSVLWWTRILQRYADEGDINMDVYTACAEYPAKLDMFLQSRQ